MREVSIAIRDLNDRTLRLLSSELGEAEKATLHDAFSHAAFPEVYGRTYTDTSIEAAIGLEGLDDSKLSEVRSLKERHGSAMVPLNERWVRAIRDKDENPGNNSMFFSAGGGANIVVMERIERSLAEGASREKIKKSPLAEAKDSRTEHDQKTLARLHSILNETEIASLPAMPELDHRRRELNAAIGDIALGGAVFIQTVEVSGDGVKREMTIEMSETNESEGGS